MSDLMQILRFAVAVTTATVLVGGAVVEVQGKVAGQVRSVPEELARAVFDRDFDFDIGEILTVGHCRPDTVV